MPGRRDEASAEARRRMVCDHLQGRGITDQEVLAAFEAVPRELFLPPEARNDAYADAPMPIGSGQTISQPYVVALMVEAMRIPPAAKVMEIGAGSGYAAAILSRLAAQVVAVERHARLAEGARKSLDDACCGNVVVVTGDGMQGYPPEAPYDAILVSARAERIPDPLKQQLAPGARLVVPVGPEGRQDLVVVERHADDTFSQSTLGAVSFVPLLPGLGDA